VLVRAGDLQPEGLQLDLRPDIDTLSYEGAIEIGVEQPVLTARVVPSRGGLKCSGRLEATARVPCSRCLEPYSLPVDRPFDLAYLPAPKQHGEEGMELQISRDEMDVAFLDDGDQLDMNVLAAEQVYLALPMKPLCSESCRGLCPGCGSNLNLEACRCAATV